MVSIQRVIADLDNGHSTVLAEESCTSFCDRERITDTINRAYDKIAEKIQENKPICYFDGLHECRRIYPAHIVTLRIERGIDRVEESE